MGRPPKPFPSERFEVYLDPVNALYLRTRFADPASQRGIKHGAISEFINRLVSEEAHRNPIVSAAALRPGSPS